MLDDESNSRLNISNQDIIVSGSNTISVDTANDLSEITKGIVTANIFTSRVSDLKTLNETNNSYTISILPADANVTADDLSTIDGKTSGRIDAGAVTSISGTYSQISSLLSSNGIYALGAVDLNVDDDLSVSQANALDNLTTGSITATIGSARVSDLLGSASLSDDNGNNIAVDLIDISLIQGVVSCAENGRLWPGRTACVLVPYRRTLSQFGAQNGWSSGRLESPTLRWH